MFEKEIKELEDFLKQKRNNKKLFNKLDEMEQTLCYSLTEIYIVNNKEIAKFICDIGKYYNYNITYGYSKKDTFHIFFKGPQLDCENLSTWVSGIVCCYYYIKQKEKK